MRGPGQGMTPTIILVRVSIGLSYHDEKSLEEITRSLCFASDIPTSSIVEVGGDARV